MVYIRVRFPDRAQSTKLSNNLNNNVMKKITKAEFVRLLSNNKSALIYAGLKRLTIETYFEKVKELKPISDRTAIAKGTRLVFSNNSILDLSSHVNNEFTISEFYQDGKYILSYLLNKADRYSNFDTESILLYYIESNN